ncbi:unnamed protein product, partial [Polarella glacialis]
HPKSRTRMLPLGDSRPRRLGAGEAPARRCGLGCTAALAAASAALTTVSAARFALDAVPCLEAFLYQCISQKFGRIVAAEARLQEQFRLAPIACLVTVIFDVTVACLNATASCSLSPGKLEREAELTAAGQRASSEWRTRYAPVPIQELEEQQGLLSLSLGPFDPDAPPRPGALCPEKPEQKLSILGRYRQYVKPLTGGGLGHY